VFESIDLTFGDCIKGDGEMRCGLLGDKGEISGMEFNEIIKSGIFSVDFDVFLVKGRFF